MTSTRKGSRSVHDSEDPPIGTTTFIPHSDPMMAKGRASDVISVSFLTCRFMRFDISASSMLICAR